MRIQNLAIVFALIASLLSLAPTPANALPAVESCGSSGTLSYEGTVVTGSTNCSGSVTIPAGIRTIANGAFFEALVTSVTFPDTLQTIGDNAFRTTRITRVDIPASVTSIGARAFSINAVPFTEVNFGLPSSLTTIGTHAFEYTDFESITIPASVTSLSSEAFPGNTVLTGITFSGTIASGWPWSAPTNVSVTGKVNCGTTGHFLVASNVVIANPSSTCAGTVTIPSYVTRIELEAFVRAQGITVIDIGDGVTHIDEHVFQDLDTLTSLTFGTGLTSIGHQAFRGAGILTTLVIPNGVTSIVGEAFSGLNLTTFSYCGSAPLPDTGLPLGNINSPACAPSSLVATAGDGTASISFSAGAAGDPAITNYKYSINGGNYSSLSTPDAVSPITISGLTNGTQYTIRLKAVNAIGDSVASASVSVTPQDPNAPGPPTSLVASGGNGSASISFTAGSSAASAITNYKYSIDDTNYQALSPSDATSPITISGLTNGTPYTIRLKAVNNYGDSLASSSVSVTPQAPTVPGPPTDVTATRSGTSASISFTAPVSNGGATIISYTATSIPGGITGTLTQANGGTINVSGLTASTSYTFDVVATNLVGDSFAGTSNSVPGGPYDRNAGNGTVACINDGGVTGSGFFTIASNHVISSSDCRGKVVIPEGVLEIDANAFFSAQHLTSIVIANTVTTIGDSAFDEASLITTLVIPDSVRIIGASAFAYAESLLSLTIGNGVTTIGAGAFYGVESLTTLTLGTSLETIENNAFRDAFNLIELVIPNNVTSIGASAFRRAESLTTLTLGNSLESIGDDAFRNVFDLTRLDIPNGVTAIGNNAFYNCNSMNTLNLGTSLGTIGNGAFENCYSLTSLVIPDSVTSIGSGAFRDADVLTSVIFGNQLQSIGSEAFLDSVSLTSLVIPANVNSIGNYAFEGATTLTSVRIENNNIVLGVEVFYYTISLQTINYCGSTYLNPATDYGADASVVVSCTVPTNYTITVSAGSNGSISPSTSNAITENSRPTYTITPSTGYEIETATLNSVDIKGSLVTVSGNTKRYTFTPVTSNQTIAVTFKLTQTTPVVVNVPVPVPYLSTLTNPKLNVAIGKLICSVGTYNAGYTLDGIIQGSSTALFTPTSFTYNLLINGIAQTSLATSTPLSTNTWNLPPVSAGSLLTCSISVTANSVTNLNWSNENSALVEPALTALSQSIKSAETVYSEAMSFSSKTYQKALVDNRAQWRSDIENIRTRYSTTLARINLVGGQNTRSEKSTALKTMIAAQKKSAADYAASKPAALARKSAVDEAASDAKNAAITKANATYGTFIESIGFGVLVP